MSDDHVIHCNDYEPSLDSPVSRWLTANEVDPRDVPLDSTVTVSGGHLAYESLVRDPLGRLLLAPGAPLYLRELRTVPLTAPPEAHGL